MPTQSEHYLPDIHRLLPQSSDAEQGFLSSFLIDPKPTGAMATQRNITGEYFHIPGHQIVFKLLMEMWDAKREIDFITLTQQLRDAKQLDQAGGPSYVTGLFTFLPTAANAAFYAEILHEKHTLRKIIGACTATAARCYDEQDDVSELVDKVQTDAITIARIGTSACKRFDTSELVKEAVNRFDEARTRGDRMIGLATGIRALDKCIGGLPPGDYIVIQGARSDGKTGTSMTFMLHQAVNLGTPVGMISLDMPARDVMARFICMEASTSVDDYRKGICTDEEFDRLVLAAARISKAPIFIDDRTGQTSRDIRSSALLMKQEHDIKLLVIDYIQKVKCHARSGEKRYEQIAGVSSDFKDLGRDLNVPLIVLSQVNSDGEVAGSKEIIDHADTVLGLANREEETEPRTPGQFGIKVNKQRNGGRDMEVPVFFEKRSTRFYDRAEDTPDLVPMPPPKKSPTPRHRK